MKTYLSFFCVLTSLSSLLCAACVKTPTITEINFEASYEGLHNENILVIGATTKRTSRNLLEGKLTKELQDQGLKPLPSYDIRPYSNILPRETVLNAAENSGIEGIFFISLIETDKKDNFDSGNKPDPYVYYENFQKLVTGSKETSTQEEQLFFLTSCLYDAKTKKQVWSLTTESDFKYTIKSLNEALTLVINQLKASGLL